MRIRLVALAAALLLGGCYAVRFQAEGRPGGEIHRYWLPFFVFGIVGDHDVFVDTACPDGVASFRVEASLVDATVSIVTLGIFTPRTAVVECTVP